MAGVWIFLLVTMSSLDVGPIQCSFPEDEADRITIEEEVSTLIQMYNQQHIRYCLKCV
jgi:hypothetical protein